jgi:predicted RNA binding protein YcfA (HicA-like mRNA interferase family)
VPGRLRRLSGSEAIRILEDFGFERVGRRGSHVKLRRIGPVQERQTLHVPLHRELRDGTLRAIVRQAAQYIPFDDLRRRFYLE